MNLTYDGSDLVAEYDAANALQRRYVHGPGVDELLVVYEGATTTAKSWLYKDHLGSIVATADATGASTALYSYGPYGEPNTTSGQRFRYTGQQLIGGLGLYYYKARFYSPTLGRFLQTDPIGTADDMNLYAYVGGNPVNFNDPSGLAAAQAKILAGDLTGSVNNWWEASKAGFQSSTMGETAMKIIEGFSPTAGMAVGVGATKLVGGTVGKIAAKGVGRLPGPATDKAGNQIGRIIVDSKGNAMIEPVGGKTVAAGKGGVDTHTLYPNGSNYQRLNPQGHANNPTPHGHGHAPGTGPGMKGQGPSLDVNGNVVPWNNPAAHWPIN